MRSTVRYLVANAINPSSLSPRFLIAGGTLFQFVSPVLENERNHFWIGVPFRIALLDEFSELSLFFT